ncbi:MAG: hypothetical protein ABIE55_02475 [Candidatus Aenigmatarchaeota archaeon]
MMSREDVVAEIDLEEAVIKIAKAKGINKSADDLIRQYLTDPKVMTDQIEMSNDIAKAGKKEKRIYWY